MRYFSLLDFQHIVLAFTLGLVALVFAAAAWGGTAPRERAETAAPDPEEPPAAEDNPVAPFLLLVYAAAVAGALGYAVVVGLLGGPVGY